MPPRSELGRNGRGPEPTQRIYNFPLDFDAPERIPSMTEQGVAYGTNFQEPSYFTNGAQDLPTPDEMRTFVREVVGMGEGFNDAMPVRLITPQDLEIGEAIFQLWRNRFQRPTPVFTDRNAGIMYTMSSHVDVDPLDTSPEAPKIKQPFVKGFLKLKDLAREKISGVLTRTSSQFLIVERYLNDFLDRGGETYRDFRGLSRSHAQWAEEEGKHDDGIADVLENAGNWTPQALADTFKVNLLHQWTPPFQTARQILIYAMFQEKQTQLQYLGLKDYALKEDNAPNASAIFGNIAGDEGFHHGFYKAVVELLAEYDRPGTIADLVYVVHNYYMPAMNVVGDIRQALSDLRDVGANPKGLLRDQVILAVLKRLEFLPDGMAEIITEDFAQRPRRRPTEAPIISQTVFDAETGVETTTVFTRPYTPRELAELQPVD